MPLCDLFLYVLLAILIVGLIISFLNFCFNQNRSKSFFRNQHCIITGGSKGIGLEIARCLSKEGAKVTLISRKLPALRKAKEKLEADNGSPPNININIQTADVYNLNNLQEAIRLATNEVGPVDVLICSAGLSQPGYFLEQDASVFQHQMNVNYMGSVHAVKAVLPSMIERNKGMLTFVSSGIVAGGFLGYASYAPTKLAVRALADSLRNELVGFGVKVNIAYPPDTQTEGFDQENLTKPEETKLITPPELYSAESVAKGIVLGMKSGQYHINGPNLVQNMAISVTAGWSPRSNSLLECMLVAPLFGLIQQGWRIFHADKEAKKYGMRINQQKAKKNK